MNKEIKTLTRNPDHPIGYIADSWDRLLSEKEKDQLRKNGYLVYELSEKKYTGTMKSVLISDKFITDKEAEELYDKENWKEELQVEIMEEYLYLARMEEDAKDHAAHIVQMRKQYEKLCDFIEKRVSQSLQQGRMEMGEEIERVFDGFLLQDWSGEKEVYDEIERLKIGLLSTLNNLKTNTPTTEVER